MVQVDPQKHNAVQITIIIAVLVLVGMIAAFFFNLNQDKRKQEERLAQIDYNTKVETFETLLGDGELDRAVVQAQLLVEEYPDDSFSYLTLALGYLQLGSVTFSEEVNADLAIDAIGKALAIDPEHSGAYRLLGYAYEIKQQYPQAEEAYTKAIELNPANDVAYASRGHMYYLAGNDTAAEADLKKALEINTENAKALVDLANLYIRTNQTDVNVEELLNRAISLASDNLVISEALNVLGYHYMQQGLYRDALTQYQDAVEHNERNTAALIGIAMTEIVLLEEADSDDIFTEGVQAAIEAIEGALSINDQLTRGYLAEGYLMAAIDEPERERAAYEKARRVVTDDITLGEAEKEEMRTYITELLNELE